MTKILITGALGHIGSFCAHQFKGKDIILVDNLSTQRYSSLFHLPSSSRFLFVQEDVQKIDWNVLLKDVECVIHLAATTDAAGTSDRPELVFSNNLTGTEIIGRACLKMGVPMIYPSSTSVYGSAASVVDEDCQELMPQSPYADCKIQEETLMMDLFSNGLRGVICRLGTIYGTSPGMRFHTAVNKFCFQAVLGLPITVWETAMDQKRPYLDVKDACCAFSWIMDKKLWDGKMYNIVSSNETVRGVIDIIKTQIADVHVSYVQHRIMNQLSYEVSSERFKNTGFVFEGSIKNGIQDTITLLKNARSLSIP